jgi:hypothetical protein
MAAHCLRDLSIEIKPTVIEPSDERFAAGH